jgi:hypothetical protein
VGSQVTREAAELDRVKERLQELDDLKANAAVNQYLQFISFLKIQLKNNAKRAREWPRPQTF